MHYPEYVYPPGTRVGMLVRYNGSYADRSFCYRDKDDNFRRGIVRTYNQPVWYWTGYRWMPVSENNTNEARQDSLRAKAGRVVKDNKWSV